MTWLYLLILLALPSLADAACTGSSPTWASTPDQQSITTCIGSAISGDTINVASGTATWTTLVSNVPSILVNKGITLSGATVCSGRPVTCVDSTIINDGTTATATSAPLSITGTNARVTGFSFKDPRNLFDSGAAVYLNCASCRFDHNSVMTNGNTAGVTHGIIAYSSATTTQLIDNNYFKDNNGATNVYGEFPVAPDTHQGDVSWRSPLVPGDSNATYMEDNNYDFPTGAFDGAYDAYGGARLVLRYNTINGTNSGGHGLDSSLTYRSTFYQDIYRNTWTNPRAGAIPSIFQTRGGHFYVWQNTVNASNGSYSKLYVITNYRSGDRNIGVAQSSSGPGWCACDGANGKDGNTGSTVPVLSCPVQNPPTFTVGAGGGEGYPCRDQVGRGPETGYLTDWPRVAEGSSPVFSEPLFPAYSWGNTFKGSPATSANIDVISGSSLGQPSGLSNSETRVKTLHVVADRDYYVENASFNGTSGTGVGTTLPATCTPAATPGAQTGPAYFKTDAGSWNVSGNGDGSGLLYKCTATNTWTVAYTPYQYPHPLQLLIPVSPAAPTNLRTIGTSTNESCTIVWDASGMAGLLGYHIFNGTASGAYGTPITVTSATASAAHTSLLLHTFKFSVAATNYISVTAYNADGDSAYATEVTCTSTKLSRTASSSRAAASTRTAATTRTHVQ